MHFHKKWPLRQYCKFIDRTPVGVSKPSSDIIDYITCMRRLLRFSLARACIRTFLVHLFWDHQKCSYTSPNPGLKACEMWKTLIFK